MEKYGFVYIWFDRKHKRYYVGCRWGNINDGYICSSRWMNKAYKRRPQDFKRRILKTNINNRKQLLEKEYYYLNMIKDEELHKRYYNLKKHHFGHWVADEDKKLTVGQKISNSRKGKKYSKRIPYGPMSAENKEKISRTLTGYKHSEETLLKRKKPRGPYGPRKNKEINKEIMDELMKNIIGAYESCCCANTKFYYIWKPNILDRF